MISLLSHPPSFYPYVGRSGDFSPSSFSVPCPESPITFRVPGGNSGKWDVKQLFFILKIIAVVFTYFAVGHFNNKP